jgi:hypothetical protein
MDENNERLEDFLREFEPRQPRPLRVAAPAPNRARRLAAGTAAVLALTASVWLVGRQPAAQQIALATKKIASPQTHLARLSIFSLTRLAVDDPATLHAALDEASRYSLPACRGDNSTLRALAKE